MTPDTDIQVFPTISSDDLSREQSSACGEIRAKIYLIHAALHAAWPPGGVKLSAEKAKLTFLSDVTDLLFQLEDVNREDVYLKQLNRKTLQLQKEAEELKRRGLLESMHDDGSVPESEIPLTAVLVEAGRLLGDVADDFGELVGGLPAKRSVG